MIPRPPRSTRTDTLLPSKTLCRSINRLDAAGGVTVTKGNEVAKGNVAIYDLNRRLITMVGNVELRQGANRLSGGRMLIDLNSGRATVDGRGAARGPDGHEIGRASCRESVCQYV